MADAATQHDPPAAPRAPGFLGAGLAYSVLSALAFPPFDLWPCAFAAPAALVWTALAAARPTAPKRTGLWTAVGTLPLWAFEQRWLIDVAGLWYLLLAVNLALYTWLFIAITAGLLRRLGPAHALWVAPVVWTGIETLRGEFIWGGYAWYLAGHPLIAVPVLAAPAAVGGQYLVSLLTLALATAVLGALDPALREGTAQRRGRRKAAWFALGLVVLIWAALARLGLSPTATPTLDPTRTWRVAIIQTNETQNNKERWTLDTAASVFAESLRLTANAARHTPPPETIIWPETMFPGAALNPEAVETQRAAGLSYTFNTASLPEALRALLSAEARTDRLPATFFADALCATQAGPGIPMVVGAISLDNLTISDAADGKVKVAHTARYNSALVVNHGQVQPARYDKTELMAFGEVVPYVWRFPAVSDFIVRLGVQGWTMDLAWGRTPHTLSVPRAGAPPLLAVTPICFEATMTRVVRALARDAGHAAPGASAIVNITNDGWFGPWRGCREAHLLAARWRSVELGLPLVRAANTGISCVVDARGTITARLDPHAAGVLHASVPLSTGAATPYARAGNGIGHGALALTGVLAAWLATRARFARGGP